MIQGFPVVFGKKLAASRFVDKSFEIFYRSKLIVWWADRITAGHCQGVLGAGSSVDDIASLLEVESQAAAQEGTIVYQKDMLGHVLNFSPKWLK